MRPIAAAGSHPGGGAAGAISPPGEAGRCYRFVRKRGKIAANGYHPARGPPDDPRLRARADLLWYLRHADALARWPVLREEWAQRVEHGGWRPTNRAPGVPVRREPRCSS